MQQFLLFLMVVGIIFAAYLASRLLAFRAKGMTQGKYIRLTDRIVLGKDKGIFIVSIGQKNYLMTESAQGLSVICELGEDDLQAAETGMPGHSFKDLINLYMKRSSDGNPAGVHPDVLSDLKYKATSALSRMAKRNQGRKQADEQKKETD